MYQGDHTCLTRSRTQRDTFIPVRASATRPSSPTRPDAARAPQLPCCYAPVMRQLLCTTLLLALALTSMSAQPERAPAATTTVYVGTYTDAQSKGIYRLELDTAQGRLSEPTLAGEAVNPSFLALHPTKPVLYAVSETATVGPDKAGGVLSFTIGADGRLTKIDEQPSGGGAPCFIALTAGATHALVANYTGGSVAAFPIAANGGVGVASSIVRHAGSSVDPRRQTAPHAHSIVPMPGTSFVLSADLGIDRVLVYRFDPVRGTLTANDPAGAATTPGAGPRHIALHPSGDAVFVINELQSTIATFKWDATRGALTPVGEAVSTLPAGFSGATTTAEVVAHPHGRFVYGSNRGHDSIAAFSVGADRRLTRVGIYPSGGQEPRNFAIDPSGMFLLAANQKSDLIALFRIDQQSGALTDTKVRVKVPTPVCVRFLPRAS